MDDQRRELEDELRRVDAERDETLFGLRLERRTRSGDEGPSTLQVRYEELDARRKELKARIRALDA